LSRLFEALAALFVALLAPFLVISHAAVTNRSNSVCWMGARVDFRLVLGEKISEPSFWR
jgi:hypothetical protein